MTMIAEPSPHPRGGLRIRAGRAERPAEMHVPRGARGLVVLADVGALSAQRRALERRLRAGHIATLALDLLDAGEMHDRHNVCDVELHAARLVETSRWLGTRADTASLPLGYFGAGTGAGAALLAAAREPARVRAVVCGGGRPDVALYWLPRVKAPTLLIVGERDTRVVDWNADAYVSLSAAAKKLVIVPQVEDEEAQLLEAAAQASEWFTRHVPFPEPLATVFDADQ